MGSVWDLKMMGQILSLTFSSGNPFTKFPSWILIGWQ
jgi:hypothetical protein